MSVKTRPAEKHTTIPKTMRAMAIDRSGGPEVLSMHTLPVPVPAANEVLIAVHTAEVGGWDAEIRGGWSPDGKWLIFTTDTPAAQLFSMPSRAATPPKLAP